MAGLCPDLVGRHPGLDRTGGEACAQAVARETFGVDPRPGQAVEQDGGDSIAAQAVGLDVAVAIHRAEDRAVIASAGLAPCGKGGNRAVAGAVKGDANLAALTHLVCLAAPQVQQQPLADLFGIGPVQLHQF